MNYVIDIAIVLIILMGAIIGFRRGVIHQSATFVGFIIALGGAFLLKDWLGGMFLRWLPFNDFKDGIIYNVLFYQMLAFVIVFCIILGILKIFLTATDFLERLLKMTVVLGIISKILGMIVGAIQYYLIAIVLVLFVSQPAVGMPGVEESTGAQRLLATADNPANPMRNTVKALKEIQTLEIKANEDHNLQVLDTMLNNKVVKVDIIDELVKMGKLNIPNIESILSKYR